MKRSSYYVKCPECGALLDRGERCDCEKTQALERSQKASRERRRIIAHNLKMVENAYKEYDYA